MNLRRSFLHRSLVRRFLFFLFALALSPSPPLVAQSSPGAKTFTLNAANQNACIGTAGLPTVAIVVTGTFSATLQPQTSINGSTPQNSQVTPTSSTTAQSTITTAGNYVAGVGGFDAFCLNVSSYASGSATVVLNPSPALNAGLIGGAAGSSSPATYNGIYAANGYGLHYDGQYIQDATTASGFNTISCPNSDCNFTSADDGKICFATNMTNGGGANFRSATVILPQGTLTHTGANTATCSGGNATQTVSAAAVFIWGHDDTTALTAAWNATIAACAVLYLPGVNAQQTGPALMLVQSQQFGTPHGSTSCTGTGQSGRGLSIKGQGIRATYLIPTPNFSASSCIAGPSSNACFFGVSDGLDVEDLTIFGGGNSNPGSGFAGKAGADFQSGNWAYVKNVQLLGWGANATNGVQNGAYASGLYVTLDHLNIDGFGSSDNSGAAGGLVVSLSNQSQITLIAPQIFDEGETDLYITTTNPNGFQSFGGLYGDAGSGCAIQVTAGSTWNSYGETIGDNLSTAASGLVCVATGATANLNGDSLTSPTNSAKGIVTAGTGIARAANTAISLTGTTTTGISNAGSYFDQGGNTISATTPYSGAGNIFGSLSITGTTQTAGNVALTNFGGSPSVGTVSGNSRVEQFTITIGGTPTGTATMTVTFPTPFLAAPICNAPIVGGTNTSLGSFTTGTVSATSAAFTYVGTLVGADTLVVQVNCQ